MSLNANRQRRQQQPAARAHSRLEAETGSGALTRRDLAVVI
jgi:hypothetical protein